ncbi:MAG: PQQ-binding-like beta-propeller repeat protein, partial [Planctomycetaceae bacterium]
DGVIRMRFFRLRERQLTRRGFCLTTAGLAVGLATKFSSGTAPPAGAAQASKPDSPSAGKASSSSAWPSFRNGNQLRGIATSNLPDSLQLLWKVSVQDGVTATAAIVGDFVYAGTFGGELICFERQTGKRVWTYFSAARKKPGDFIPGFQSSPSVHSSTILIGDEDGILHAVDRKTGLAKWKLTTNAEIIASAAVIGDRAIVGSYDYTLYCVDIESGKTVWKFDTADRINGSPAIAGNLTFVTGCDQHLRAINIETGKEEFDMNLERFLIASPAVMGQMLYVGTHESEVLAIDLTTQEVLWRYDNSKGELPYHSSAAVTDNRVIIGCQDKQLHCLDRKTGVRQWAFLSRGQINSSPVVVGNSRVFVGSNDGHIYEIDLTNGRQRWKMKLGRSVTASPAVGEGVLVIGAEGTEGEIYCFGQKQATGKSAAED